MVQQSKIQTETQTQKAKLISSYNALHEEFSSRDLQTVGNYTVGALIGKGSFGKVYLASHKLINRSKVVLKSAKKDDPNLPREIHHHRQFLHPHIARLYEVIVTENLVWLVLEYCPGDELYYHLTHNGPIEPEKVKKIFSQLVGAVSYVHQKSCVHRDLKLENILLDKNGDVKLCDFGFTREYEGRSSYLQTWCGTVCYSAPEMLKGEKYAGEKVDVWSLGVILYALLCGELPFDEDDDDKTKMKILKEEPQYPETMPKPARDLISSLLSKRPLLRPSLSDILTHSWFADYAPTQQAILKLQQPAPFTTQLEYDTLQRMRSAGVDTDAVKENVLSQRCDALAGWWALLLEKEERKEMRRQRRRSHKDAETKASRRISTASGRLLTSTIQEADEERSPNRLRVGAAEPRGRSPRRPESLVTPPSRTQRDVSTPLSPQAMTGSYPRSVEYRAHHRASSSRRRSHISQLGLGVPSGKRSSIVHVVSTSISDPTTLQVPEGVNRKRKRRYQPLFFAHFANLKSWFKEPSNRLRKGMTNSSANLRAPQQISGPLSPRPNDLTRISTELAPATEGFEQKPDLVQRNTMPTRPQVATHSSSHSQNRITSHSPSPITPRSSYRRSTGGSIMRGRKSTSSSVSSVRSFAANNPAYSNTTPHASYYPSHSKASSASSGTGVSISSPTSLTVAASAIGKQQQHRRRSSPNTSAAAATSFVKVIPSTSSPGPGSSFASAAAHYAYKSQTSDPNVTPTKRVPPRIKLESTEEPAHDPYATRSNPFAGIGPPSPGLPIFARRKRTPFRGPNLLGPGRRRSDGSGMGGGVDGATSGGSTITALGRSSQDGQPALIEEEDEDGFEDVEPDAFGQFSPIEAPTGAGFGMAGLAEGEEEDEDEAQDREQDLTPRAPRTRGAGGTGNSPLQSSPEFAAEFQATHNYLHGDGQAVEGRYMGPGSVFLRADSGAEVLNEDDGMMESERPLTKWELQQ